MVPPVFRTHAACVSYWEHDVPVDTCDRVDLIQAKGLKLNTSGLALKASTGVQWVCYFLQLRN